MMTAALVRGPDIRGLDPAQVEESPQGTVYLLHLDDPFWSLSHTYCWTHYIGHARQGGLVARLEAHASGQGAKFTRLARKAGCTWHLARTWPGDRNRERQVKRQGGASRFCPSCGVLPLAERQQFRSTDGRYLTPPGRRPYYDLEITRSKVLRDGKVLAELSYDGPVVTVVRDGRPAGRLTPSGGEGTWDAWTAKHPAAFTPSDRMLTGAAPLPKAVAVILNPRFA